MNNRQQINKKPTAELEMFTVLSQDEDWLAGFIQNTEENWMLQAPSHMKQEVLSQLSLLPKTVKETKKDPVPQKTHSKNMQLFFYSIRVTGAVAGAILFLFTAPPALSPFGVRLKEQQAGMQRFSDSIQNFSNDFFFREVSPND